MNINKIITKLSAIKRFCRYALRYRRMLKMQQISNTKTEGEDEYRRYWGRFTKLVEPYSYRLFSLYCGKTKYIIPEDIGHSYIEAVLNNERYTAYYSDKNMFPTYLPQGAVPQILLCRIGGGNILDRNYNLASVDFASTASQMYTNLVRMHTGGCFLNLRQNQAADVV